MKIIFLAALLGLTTNSGYSQFNLNNTISWPLVCGQPVLASFNVRIPTEDSAFYYYSIGKCSPSSYADNKLFRTDSSFHTSNIIFTSYSIEEYLIKLVSCPNGHCCYNYYNSGINVNTLSKYLLNSGWSTIGTPADLCNMQFIDDHNGFAITSYGLFYRYNNDTLSTLFTIQNCYDAKIYFRNLNVGFILCKDTINGVYNRLLKSVDNGSTWSTVLHNSIDTLSQLTFVTDSCFLLTTHTRAVYRSTDQGLTWSYLLQIPSNISSYSFVSDSIILGLNGWSVMKTHDAGNNWNSIQTINPIGNFGGLNTIAMINDSVGYIIGIGTSVSSPMSQWIIIYKTVNGGVTYSEINKFNQPLKIYPNPTNGECKVIIPDEFKNEAKLSLQIIDNLGKTIMEDYVESLRGEVDIKLKKGSGVNTIRLNNGSMSFIGKVIIE